jgi:putative ABC transport system permease protein
MLKNYFKIFLKVASQSKLFTFLSLFGISLTIMFVMIFSMTISKITNGSGPEKELKKIVFCQRVKTKETHNGKYSNFSVASCGRSLCEEHLKNVKSANLSSMYTGPNPWEFIFNGKHQLKIQNQTDAEFWNIFDYKFLEGRPYTKEEVIKGANLAVISHSLKELLFGSAENVLGKTIQYSSINLIVTGVIEDPPKTDQNAIGDLYFPYTVIKNNDWDKYIGGFIMAYKAESPKQFPLIRSEIKDIIARLDVADTTKAIFLSGPYSQFEKMMVGYGDPEDYSRGTSLIKYLLSALAFILLPAVNLMALNFARINERGEEIAVRKSFGASSKVLRRQFLFENILMTLTGGVLGILLSYLVVALLGNSLTVRIDFLNNVPLSFSFNYTVFAVALISCLIFGLLSGYLPAVRLSRMKPAVYLKGGEL